MGTIRKKWKCSVCGYIHYGLNPPDICPICGVSKDLFQDMETDTQSSSQNTTKKLISSNHYKVEKDEKVRVIIAGGGIAGVSAAEAVRKESGNADILLLSKEKSLPYYRINLTRFIAGEISGEDLILHNKEWYETGNIRLMPDKELTSINKSEKQITVNGNETLNYDRLIIATGSHPFIPPIKGVDLLNVTPLRTKEDADFILRKSESVKSVIVIGGGILGLETAAALVKKDLDVTVIEGFSWLLPQQLNRNGGMKLEEFVKKQGIKLQLNSKITQITGSKKAEGVLLEGNIVIPGQLIIIATGVRSNTYPARQAGLEVDRGVIANNFLESSCKDIFVAGDVAEHFGVSYGTWEPAMFQGTIAGKNVVGGNNEFAGIPRSNILKVLDYDMFSMGTIVKKDGSYIELEATMENNYYCFIFKDNKMVGAIILGKSVYTSIVNKAIKDHMDFSEILCETCDINSALNQLRELPG